MNEGQAVVARRLDLEYDIITIHIWNGMKYPIAWEGEESIYIIQDMKLYYIIMKLLYLMSPLGTAISCPYCYIKD